jgi:flagella basal body P-ring formation protein FlgA
LLRFRLRGPARIAIRGGADPAFLRRCRRDLIEKIQATPPWDNWTISVRFGLDDDRQLAGVSPEYATLTVQPRDTSSFLGSVALDVTFADAEGNVLLACALAPTILREVSVLMVAEGSDRGHTLTAADLRQTSVWLSGDAASYVTDPSAAVGCELNRRLVAGALLRASYLSPPMCARRGELVKVVYQSGGLTVSMNALAVENGRLGDRIRLRNTTSETVFSAVLDGRRRACFFGY